MKKSTEKSSNKAEAEKLQKPVPEPAKTARERFKTFQDIFADPMFTEKANGILSDIVSRRQATLAAAAKIVKSPKLKRGPFDVLQEKGLLSPEALSLLYLQVQSGQVSVPAVVRDYVNAIIIDASQQTIKHYVDQEQNECKSGEESAQPQA